MRQQKALRPSWAGAMIAAIAGVVAGLWFSGCGPASPAAKPRYPQLPIDVDYRLLASPATIGDLGLEIAPPKEWPALTGEQLAAFRQQMQQNYEDAVFADAPVAGWMAADFKMGAVAYPIKADRTPKPPDAALALARTIATERGFSEDAVAPLEINGVRMVRVVMNAGAGGRMIHWKYFVEAAADRLLSLDVIVAPERHTDATQELLMSMLGTIRRLDAPR